jgi:septal ring factor EnvC (AmiA/AmiB activator)
VNRLRTGGQARISFFSFQDIITSVTGILILVTLMLSFNVTTAEPVSSEEQKLQTARERLREVEAENERLQQRRREAATLPDQAQLQAQIESLRREQAEVEAQRKQLEATLTSARERVAKQTATNSAAELREQIEAAEKRLEELRPKALQSRTNVNAVYIVPDADVRRNEKKAVAIVVSGTQLRAQRLDGSEVFEAAISSPDSLKPILTGHNADRDFLVFYFRPSGAKWFEDFRKLARQGGFEVGYDAVEEQKQIIFSSQ